MGDKELEKIAEEIEQEEVIEPLVDRIKALSPFLSDYIRSGGDMWASFEKEKKGRVKKIISFLTYNPPEKTYYFSIRLMGDKGKEYKIFEKDIEEAVITFIAETFSEIDKKLDEFEGESVNARNIFIKIKDYLKRFYKLPAD